MIGLHDSVTSVRKSIRAVTSASVVLLFALSGGVSLAQAQRSIAVEATVGAARGNGAEFRDRRLQGVRIALSVRTSSMSRVAPYIEGATDWISLSMGHDAVCELSSRGGCKPTYPELQGPELVIGVLLRAHSRLELRGGIGGGAYRTEETRIGGWLAQADVAAFAAKRLAIVAGTRLIVIPRYRGDRLTTLPWNLGLRIR